MNLGTSTIAGIVILVALAGSSAPVMEQRVVAILDELEQLDTSKHPIVVEGKSEDVATQAAFVKAEDERKKRRLDLILDLYRAAPDHPKVSSLLGERWYSLGLDAARCPALVSEINAILFDRDVLELRVIGLNAKTRALSNDPASIEDAIQTINLLAHLKPGSEQVPRLLAFVHGRAESRPPIQARIGDRILKEFSGSDAAESIAGMRRRRDAVGKPFDLKFDDAVTGSHISMDSLRGQVVVIDFWATWCPPCIASVPG